MSNRTEVARRKPRRISTGRLQSLRLFSTLLIDRACPVRGQNVKSPDSANHRIDAPNLIA
jgi:hypothetical protein